MSNTFYLPRTLLDGENIYNEAKLVVASRYIVVLAEPGGGKTELLESLSHQLGINTVTANVFAQIGASESNIPLIIDAFDELAKIDAAGIHKLLGNAKKANPTHVIISSRSSEWDNAATNAFKTFFGHAPLVVRLREFDETEQKAIFDHHSPGESFSSFQTEVARFDLEALLPNPQFLKLFADSYIESGRHFTTKRTIFEQAVERLAREVNLDVARRKPTFAIGKKVELASEVFAKLLLSGAEGVGTSDVSESRLFPILSTLLENNAAAESILATRLFKPGDTADRHRPVHKIVSEYCAANYIIDKIADPRDPLSFSKCLPIIAPNSTVRDELRGMLGWMASLGNQIIQEAAIDLDPYAVLANGDPSQLESASKRQLIHRLKDIEYKDPYFRRGDFWRRFSVAGFFTNEVVDEIKPLLAKGGEGHLRQLMLELLSGSPAISMLTAELRQLIIAFDEDEHIREIASTLLLETAQYDPYPDLAILVFEASQASLKLAARIIESLDPSTLGPNYLANFFRVCAHLYPNHSKRFEERTVGGRYFIKRIIASLDLKTVEWLLDDCSKDLTCTCGNKQYECDCRNGMSKIIGSMLDRYFDLAEPPHDIKRTWQWLRNLNFHEQRSLDQSVAVRALQNDELRQGIIGHVFGALRERHEIRATKLSNFGWMNHSGLFFQAKDYEFVVNLAFETDNSILWSSFMAFHQHHRRQEERGSDSLRRHMRLQAMRKPEFLKEWTISNRAARVSERENRIPSFRHSRKMKRRRRKADEARLANIKFVQDNREIVESGRHWNCLVRFADLALMHPEKIELEFGDEVLVRAALRNSIDFISEFIPSLHCFAELQCASKGLTSERILYAACLEIMRVEGNLESVEIRLLQALRTGIGMSYDAVSEDLRHTLEAEVNRLIFPNSNSIESFLRCYLETQLATSACAHPQIWWLDQEVFSSLRAKLAIEWLDRFRGLAIGPLDTLFEMAAQYGDRDELIRIIEVRCAEFLFFWPDPSEDEALEQKRLFWFVRAWYFLDKPLSAYWEWLKLDRNTLLVLHGRSGRMSRNEHPSWPKLTSAKVEAIVGAFVGRWPKVDLPSSFGSDSPDEEKAYRFLTEVVWNIGLDNPDDALLSLDRLIADPRCIDFQRDLKSIRASQIRNKALRDFAPPTPTQIVRLLDHDEAVTVEGLRNLVVQELQYFQKSIDGGEFNSASSFYEKSERLGEVRCTEIIAERLSLRLQSQSISITPEHQLKAAKRSDFTATKMIGGRRRLLVTEVKGQWNKELYTAASAQLYERYAIHPDAEQQGIFLVIWFGAKEKVAGLRAHGIANADDLKKEIEMRIPSQLTGLIDVFVLDVSMK